MKKRRLGAGLLAVSVAFVSAAASFLAGPAGLAFAQDSEQTIIEAPVEGTYVKGEALISMTTTQAAALTKEGTVNFDRKIQVEECWDFGAAGEESSERVRDFVALVRSDTYSTQELMEIVSEKYYVDAVAPNSYAHLCQTGSDPLSDYQWYLNGEGAMRTDSIGIHAAGVQVSASMQPVVALIDTGVDYTNEDIKDSMWVNPYQSKGLEGTYGYDFAENDADPMDRFGHGTHCAGIIAAQTGNGTGIAGISNAKIMALKVAKDGEDTFETAGVIAAYEYVVRAQQLGVPVAAVNCSWGGGYDTGAVLNTLIDKMGENGALSVFAAGNDGVNWDAVAVSRRQTPYDMKSKYIVIVGASDENDNRAAFSDYGKTQVDLFAPGSNILSTVHETKFLPQFWTQEKRERMTVYYNTFDQVSGLYTAENIKNLRTNYTVGLSYESGMGFSDHGNGCLKYTVRRNRNLFYPMETGNTVQKNGQEQAGFIYLDVTDLHLDEEQTFYISGLMMEDGAEDASLWEPFEKVSSAKDSRFIVSGERTYLALIGIMTQSFRTSTYYIDNIAISVPDPDLSQFEKCSIMSGSSMAGPMVSAAAAILRAANPSQKASGIRSMLLACTRSANGVADACVTGGILDLSHVTVWASGLKLNKTSANVRYGKTLQLKATVSPSNVSNAKVTWSSGNTKYAVVSASGKVTVKKAGIGKKVKITASTKDGSKLKKTCTVHILAKK